MSAAPPLQRYPNFTSLRVVARVQTERERQRETHQTDGAVRKESSVLLRVDSSSRTAALTLLQLLNHRVVLMYTL